MAERGKEIGWNTDLQAPTYAPRDPDINHLRFLRDLMEKRKFGRPPAGVPKGEFVFRLNDAEIRKYAMQQGDQELKAPQSMYEQQH